MKSIHGQQRRRKGPNPERLRGSRSCRARKRGERSRSRSDTIRGEGQTISAATTSLLTDRTAESGVLKGWISERLPGKQGAELHGAPERGCLSSGRAGSKLRGGSAPSGDCASGPQVSGNGIKHAPHGKRMVLSGCF